MKKIFLHLPSKFTEIFFNSTNVLILNFNEYKFYSVSFTSLGKGNKRGWSFFPARIRFIDGEETVVSTIFVSQVVPEPQMSRNCHVSKQNQVVSSHSS